MITGVDSNISDKCNIQKYNLEFRRKLKAYTMSRFYIKLINRINESANYKR